MNMTTKDRGSNNITGVPVDKINNFKVYTRIRDIGFVMFTPQPYYSSKK